MSTPNKFHPALKGLINCGNIHIPAEKIHTRITCNDKPVDVAAENEKILNTFIENLELEIDKSIQEKVKALTRRFIILTGSDFYLLEAIEAYIYCLRGKASLYLYDLAGKTPEEMKGILYSVHTYFDNNEKLKEGSVIKQLEDGATILLNNLRCSDNLLFDSLSKEIHNIDSNTGMLIITLSGDKNTLPERFTNLFEVINLEPEKQEQANGQDAVSGNIFRKEGNYWTIQYNGKLTRINECFGLGYIAYLLKNKDRDFYTHEVIQEVNKEQFQSIQSDFKSEVESKEQDGFFDDNQEIDKFDQSIKVKASDNHEKLRKRISKNITDALSKIKQHDQDLWKHISNSISTGHTLSYKPKDHTMWNL